MTVNFPTSKPLSIGFVSPAWPPDSVANGIASYTGTMVKALRERGVTCHVFSRSVAGGMSDPHVHPVQPDYDALYSRFRHRLDPLSWPQQRFADALASRIIEVQRREGLDLVEMEESFGWAGLIAARCPVPIVVRLHGPWFLNGAVNGAPTDKSFRHRDAMEANGLAAAAAITSPSADVLQQTRDHFRVKLPHAAVIANPAAGSVDARWSLAQCDSNRIAFVGRFDRHKGGDIALRAFAKIINEAPRAFLDFVGPDRGCKDDSGRNWSLEQYLNAHFDAEKLAHVQVHGFKPASDAAQIRKKALVTIVPSRYETFGLTAAEAMLAGCPLVVSGAGALTELVQYQRNGLVAKPGDADDLAEKVLSLLQNPRLAAGLGQQAAIDAAQRYSPGVVAEQTLRFYRNLLSR